MESLQGYLIVADTCPLILDIEQMAEHEGLLMTVSCDGLRMFHAIPIRVNGTFRIRQLSIDKSQASAPSTTANPHCAEASIASMTRKLAIASSNELESTTPSRILRQKSSTIKT